jgi:hypothetical protein
MTNLGGKANLGGAGGLGAGGSYGLSAHARAFWTVECWRGVEWTETPAGVLAPDYRGAEQVWFDEFENLVVTVGKNHLLDVGFHATSQVTTWYVGLKDTGTVVAGDTMGSHGGWAELTVYSDANRPAYNEAAAASGSMDNSANKAVFNINATDDVYGCFLASDNTKGGTTGTLYGAGDFTVSPRSVVSGDTLNVTLTLTL